MKSILSILLPIFEKMAEKEQEYLSSPKWYGLFFGRLISILFILIFSIICYALAIFSILYIFEYLNYEPSNNPNYLWTILLLFALPSILPIIFNLFDKEFNFCRSLLNILKISTVSFNGATKLNFYVFDVFIFILYVTTLTSFTIMGLSNFLREDTLVNLIPDENAPVFAIIAIFHASVYLTIRNLCLPNKTIIQKVIAAKRKYYLWILAMIFTVIYMINKLLTQIYWYDGLYFIFVLLIAFDRIINSYKDLKDKIDLFNQDQVIK
jgi:hypothetical protein